MAKSYSALVKSATVRRALLTATMATAVTAIPQPSSASQDDSEQACAQWCSNDGWYGAAEGDCASQCDMCGMEGMICEGYYPIEEDCGWNGTYCDYGYYCQVDCEYF